MKLTASFPGPGRGFLLAWAGIHLALAASAVQAPTAVSVALQDSVTAAGNSFAPVFSADGRFIAFLSHANNLVTNDDRAPHLDLFLRSLATSNTVLVSVSSNGVGGANDNVALVALSADARFVAFETAASNLVPGDANFAGDIFVRDVGAGVTRLASVNAAGTGSGNGRSFNPLLSADGRYVVFESAASDLVTNDFNGTNDVFIRDLLTGSTTLVTVNGAGTASADGASHSPSISSNGLFVAFISHATNLVAGVTNQLGEVYVRDIAAGSNRWAEASYFGSTRDPATGAYTASEPVLSADGRFVAFKTALAVVRLDLTRPTNVVFRAIPPNPLPHLDYFAFQDNPRLVRSTLGGLGASPFSMTPDGRYLAFATGTNQFGATFQTVLRADFDGLVTNVDHVICCEGGMGPDYYATNVVPEVVVVSTNFGGLNAHTNRCYAPVISADGRLILFLSQAPDAANALPDGQLRLYLRDMGTSTLQVLSTNRSGRPAALVDDVTPVLKLDGTVAAWETSDEDLVVGDQNSAFDIVARDLGTGAMVAVSQRHPALPVRTGRGIAGISPGGLTADGRRVVFRHFDSGLRPLSTNRWTDGVLRDFGAGTNMLLSANYIMPNPPGVAVTVQPTNHSTALRVSADGRYLTFVAGHLDPDGGTTNIIWRDLVGGTNATLIRFWGDLPTTSADGRLVAFHSRYDPISLISGNYSQIWLFAPEIPGPPSFRGIVPVTPSGDNHSINPVLSPDGGWVAFQSLAANLTTDPDLFQPVHQLFATRILRGMTNAALGVTKVVSYVTTASSAFSGRSTERPWPTGATNPVFSADSRYVFFSDGVSNVIYRHDFQAPDVITVTPHPEPGGTIYFTNIARVTNLTVCANCANPSPDLNGQLVAYESPAGSNATRQIWLRNLPTGSLESISVNDTGTGGGNGSSTGPLLSWDGRFVVFTSKASDLVPGDTNRASDVFVRDRAARVTFCLSRNGDGSATGNRLSSSPVLSPDGRTVAFQSFASDLVPGDYNDTRDVFVVSLSGPDTDADGLEDDWEMTFFSTLARDGSGDFDGDGASDAQEFRAGTDPTNTGSVFRVLTLTTAVGPQTPTPRTTTVFWAATRFRSYRVQMRSGDVTAPWTDLPGDVLATGPTASKTHVTFVGGPPRAFYRVLLLP